MIKVIKHRDKTFKTTCPICGCEFEYEGEDIREGGELELLKGSYFVECPECGKPVIHPEFTLIYPHYPNITWDINKEVAPLNPYRPYRQNPYATFDIGDNLNCGECPNKPDPSNPVVGDTPCTWCRKNQPYCSTCTSSTTTSFISSEE